MKTSVLLVDRMLFLMKLCDDVAIDVACWCWLGLMMAMSVSMDSRLI